MKYSLEILFCVASLLHVATCSNPFADIFPSRGFCDLCPKEKQDDLSTINSVVNRIGMVPECGPGLWLRVVDLNVTGEDTTCPDGWVFVDSGSNFGCTRPNSVSGCGVASFSPPNGLRYTGVCGKITGTADGNPNGFSGVNSVPGMVDGVTVSSSTDHIWSFAVGGSRVNASDEVECPCDTRFPNSAQGATNDTELLDLVDENYFCDRSLGESSELLWTPTCTEIIDECCELNPRPYFSRTFLPFTDDDVDVSICTGQPASNNQVFVQRMELFIGFN